MSSNAFKSVVVRAGAGAGKTTELVNRVLQIAQDYQAQYKKWPKLVVTTFTRKATQELRERLMKKAMTHSNQDLVEFIQSESHLHISTIHGVLSVFLSRYGYLIGLAPQFNFIDENLEQRYIKKILRHSMQNPEFASDMETLLEELPLNKIICSVLSYIDANLDGALQELSLASREQILISLWKKDQDWIIKAQELIEYIESNEPSEKWKNYSALLSRTAQILQTKPLLQKILNESPNRKIAYQNFNEQKERLIFKRGTDKTISQLKRDLHSEVKKNAEDWTDSEDYFQRHEIVGNAFRKVASQISNLLFEKKISNAHLTMKDLEYFSIQLIKNFPESSQYFSSEWDYWFVDEYQDTSPRQVSLLKSLIGDRHSFTVGDPQQSIYLFRGARSEVFSNREIEIKQNGGELLSMMNNYRSRPELLNFFNHFFSNLGTQFQPMNPTSNTIKTELQNSHAALFISATVAESEKTNATDVENEDLKNENVKSVDEIEQPEIDAVLMRILDLLNSGISAENICVLGRTNGELEILSHKASKLNIPVQLHASSKFLHRREILDALSVLKFIVNPFDNINFVQLLRSPWFCISDSEILKICSAADQSYWTKSNEILKDNRVIIKLNAILEKAQVHGVSMAWQNALLECGIFDMANRVDPTRRREANLWKIVSQLKMQERSPGFNYLEFSERSEAALNLNTDSDADATPVEEPKRVNFMTIHASKGLQFDHVIIPFMGKINIKKRSAFFVHNEQNKIFSVSLHNEDTGKLCSSSYADEVLEKNKQAEMAEYDRLLYVAMTRAKLDVTLIWSKVTKQSWADRMWRPALTTTETATAAATAAAIAPTFAAKTPPQHTEILKSNHFALRGKNSHADSLTPLVLADREITILKPQLSEYQNLQTVGSSSVTALISENKTESSFDSLWSTLDEDKKNHLTDRVKKVQRGISLHRIFESIKYREMNEIKKLAKNSHELTFLMNWEHGRILRWIQNGEVEWGFCYLHNDQWIQGQIDLWCVDNCELWVVDYKTGSEEYKQMAFEQLKHYARAIKIIKKIPLDMGVNLVVIYPHLEKVVINKLTNAKA